MVDTQITLSSGIDTISTIKNCAVMSKYAYIKIIVAGSKGNPESGGENRATSEHRLAVGHLAFRTPVLRTRQRSRRTSPPQKGQDRTQIKIRV